VVWEEPLSVLDAKLRDQMRSELAQLQDKVGVTFLMVTHDQDEALAMACRCAVMNRGALQQVATPSDLYEYPNSRFVADFIGQVNLLEGRLDVDAPDHAIITVPALGASIYVDHGVTGPAKGVVWAAIRPEKMRLTHRKPSEPPPHPGDCPEGHNIAAGTIRQVSYLGSVSSFEVETEGAHRLKVMYLNPTRGSAEEFTLDQPVWVSWHAAAPAI